MHESIGIGARFNRGRAARRDEASRQWDDECHSLIIKCAACINLCYTEHAAGLLAAAFRHTISVTRFFFHLRLDDRVEKDSHGFECTDVHAAYLVACRIIPDLAATVTARGGDPLQLTLDIALHDGSVMMEVPFAEVIRPRQTKGGLIMPRSRRAMVRSAEKYRAAFADAPFGVLILTPELEYVSVNRMVTELTSESDATTNGLFLESPEIRARDPGDSIPRAVASIMIARDARRSVQDAPMFWGEMRRTAVKPPLTIGYWPIIEDDLVVALGIRLDSVQLADVKRA